MPTTEIKFRVLLFRDGPVWVSQCLDYDLNSQGQTPRDAVASVARVVATRALLDMKAGIEPLSQMRPAPEQYNEMLHDTYSLGASDFPPVSTKEVRATPSELRLQLQ